MDTIMTSIQETAQQATETFEQVSSAPGKRARDGDEGKKQVTKGLEDLSIEAFRLKDAKPTRSAQNVFYGLVGERQTFALAPVVFLNAVGDVDSALLQKQTNDFFDWLKLPENKGIPTPRSKYRELYPENCTEKEIGVKIAYTQNLEADSLAKAIHTLLQEELVNKRSKGNELQWAKVPPPKRVDIKTLRQKPSKDDPATAFMGLTSKRRFIVRDLHPSDPEHNPDQGPAYIGERAVGIIGLTVDSVKVDKKDPKGEMVVYVNSARVYNIMTPNTRELPLAEDDLATFTPEHFRAIVTAATFQPEELRIEFSMTVNTELAQYKRHYVYYGNRSICKQAFGSMRLPFGVSSYQSTTFKADPLVSCLGILEGSNLEMFQKTRDQFVKILEQDKENLLFCKEDLEDFNSATAISDGYNERNSAYEIRLNIPLYSNGSVATQFYDGETGELVEDPVAKINCNAVVIPMAAPVTFKCKQMGECTIEYKLCQAIVLDYGTGDTPGGSSEMVIDENRTGYDF